MSEVQNAPAGNPATKTGYVSGSDLLLKVNGKPIGHCTSHSITYNTETKEHVVKPVATVAKSRGLWKDKTVVGLSVSINFEGLRFYGETEGEFSSIRSKWSEGTLVDVESFHRSDDSNPALTGQFVIDSLEESNPAGDDATYSGSLSSSGEVTINEFED